MENGDFSWVNCGGDSKGEKEKERKRMHKNPANTPKHSSP